MLWAKYRFFEKGIGPEEFRNMQVRDIKDIFAVDSAINSRKQREAEVEKIKREMDKKW